MAGGRGSNEHRESNGDEAVFKDGVDSRVVVLAFQAG